MSRSSCCCQLGDYFLSMNSNINIGNLLLGAGSQLHCGFSQLWTLLFSIMKDSKCGRIVQQRPSQSRLIRDYDTHKFHDIHYERVNELKDKYRHPSDRSPFSDLASRSNIRNNFEDIHVPLTIFSEKDSPSIAAHTCHHSKQRSELMKQSYGEKAQIVNQNISQKLSWIEEQFDLLKKQMMRRQQEEEKAQREIIMNAPIKLQPIKLQSLKLQVPPQIRAREAPLLPSEYEALMIQEVLIAQSNCKLMGQMQQGRVFSQEFRTLIHRLKNQISLDYEFTQLMLAISRADLSRIRDYLKATHPTVDLSFFQVSPMEMDPLQPVSTAPVSDVASISQKLFKYYDQIEEHFAVKLFRKFSREAVGTLFQQIGDRDLTLGHVISYVNMQTGREFRNRALVKLLRRMDICTHKIDESRFYQALCF